MECSICGNELLQYNEYVGSVKWYCVVCKTYYVQRSVNPIKSVKEIYEEIETQSQLSEQLTIRNSVASVTNNEAAAFDVRNINFTQTEQAISFAGYTNNTQEVESKVNAHKHFQPESLSKGNILFFKEVPNEFKNPESATAPCDNGEYQKSLSAKALLDFDSHNTFNSKEVLQNYLESYSPVAAFQNTVYDCPCLKSAKQVEMATKTVSISTESETEMKSTCLEPTEDILTTKFKIQNYTVMPASAEAAHAVQNIEKTVDKNNNVSTDVRMQHILETLNEGAKINSFREKPALMEMPSKTQTKEVKEELIQEMNTKNKEKILDIIQQLLNINRCFYNPPNSRKIPIKNLPFWPKPQPVEQESLLPQFQSFLSSTNLAQEFLLAQAKATIIKPVSANTLKIPRHPLLCPETTCRRLILMSDINKHFVADHNHPPIEQIAPFECKNFVLDTRSTYCGASKCHFLYLLRDKIVNFGSIEYKDLLPILIMSTRISFDQRMEHFFIWVASISSEDLPISVSLTVWARSDRFPSCHVVYSGPIYSVRNSQNALDVLLSGRMLSLSAQEVAALTNNGSEMLNLQLSVH